MNYIPDNDDILNWSVAFNDKEYITAGPRPPGSARCFAPIQHRRRRARPRHIGVDRLYVSWTLFLRGAGVLPDQRQLLGRPRPFVVAAERGQRQRAVLHRRVRRGQCKDNQGSVPTVNPTTGELWVGFMNCDTPDENQYLVVTLGRRRPDVPGAVLRVVDVRHQLPAGHEPAGLHRPGAQTRSTLTNCCFRINSYGNIVADKRGGEFADDLYIVLDDNRNGQRTSSNVDVFFFTSNDGGRRGSARRG